MSLKRPTLFAYDVKALIKINPLRVKYLVSRGQEYTRIHFGLDRTIDVTGRLEAGQKVLG